MKFLYPVRSRRFKMILWVALTGSTLWLSAAIAHAEFTTPIAITNVKIVNSGGTIIESGTIVIEEGRIVQVGATVDLPLHAEIFDAKGLIAYPGFIDAHSHLGIAEEKRKEVDRVKTEDVNPDQRQGPLAATRFANRRGIRPQIRASEIYTANDKQLKSHQKLGFTAALIAPRDGLLSGSSDLFDLSGDPIRQSIILSNVAQHGSYTAGEEGRYPRSLLGIFAQFRQFFLDAARHAKLQKYALRHPNDSQRVVTDAALDAVQSLLGTQQRLIFEANSEWEIRRILKLAEEFHLDIAISGAKEAYKVIDRLQYRNIPLIVSLKFDEEPEYGKKKKSKGKKKKEGEEKQAESKKKDNEKDNKEKKEKKEKKIYEPLKLRKERRRLWDEKVDNVIRLHEAEISFAFRTRDFKDAKEFFKNLRKVIKRGLPENAAIDALTQTPGKYFGLPYQLGKIAPDQIANLTLMDKPFTDEKTKVKYLFIRGKKIEIDQEDKKSSDKGKHGNSDDNKEDSSSEDEEADVDTAEPTDEKADEKDHGPTYEVEIKADRIPKNPTNSNVIVQNATIIPVSSPTLIDATILIRNGRIEAMGHNIAAPPGVRVIDGTGLFVIPGFVDAHSHLGVDAVNEGALSISAEVRIADVINPDRVGIYRAAAGGTTTHHVMHGSANPIGGQNIIMKTKYGRNADEMLMANAPPTIKFALGENVTQANFFKNWGKRFPNTRMGVESTIRTALEAAKTYQQEWEDYERKSANGIDLPPPRRDLRLEALAKILSGKLTVHSHCYRSDEILRLMAVAEDYGFRIGTLQHVLEGYRIAPEIARHGSGASTFSNFWAYKVEAYGAIPHNAALMTEHGINSSINSDSANTIRYMGQEAAKSIKWGGLNENQALRLVTLNPAMQLQIDDSVGSLAVGMSGDLAIFNGHPLNTFSKCIMTIIEGEIYFEDDQPESTEPCSTLHIVQNVDHTIPQTDHRVYAIVGATIHPVSSPAIENGTVVIVEDKIHAVGRDVTVPPGAGVIDGKGLHVYPGLIDASSRLGLNEIGSLRGTRDYGDISKFGPQLRTISAVHPHSEHIRIARTAGITSTLATPASGGGFFSRSSSMIYGQSAVIHLEGWTASQMSVVNEFGLHVSVPSLPIHLPQDKKRKEEMKKKNKQSTKELKEFFIRARHYAKVKELSRMDSTIPFEVDLKLEAMIPYVNGEKPVVFVASSYKKILDSIEFAEKHELKMILSGAAHAWKLADVLAEKNIAVILSTPLSYPRGEFETWDGIYRCASVLQKAGVKFCFGSGSAANAYDLGTQAGMAVAHGLSKKDAEYGLTLGAAQILGIDKQYGSIEVGKTADIIVTTDTPLQTISRVTHMFIKGDPIELTSMHTESYEKFRNRPEPRLTPLPDLIGPPSLTAH